MKDDPRTFHIVSDEDGFYIEDDYGLEVETWPPFFVRPFRALQMKVAEEMLDLMVKDWLDNYDPPDSLTIGDAWSGGFADNH